MDDPSLHQTRIGANLSRSKNSLTFLPAHSQKTPIRHHHTLVLHLRTTCNRSSHRRTIHIPMCLLTR